MTSIHSSKRASAGMTLVELILVMMVIFTLATVALPRFTDTMPALQVRTAGSQVLSWARKARADAALSGARQRLVFDVESRKYWLEAEMKPLKEAGKFTPLGGSWQEETLPGDVVFESLEGAESDGGRRYVEFRPDGTCTGAVIVVANDRDDKQTITIVGASSRITLEKDLAQ